MQTKTSLQRALLTGPGRVLAQWGYEAVVQVAAEALSRLDRAESVYVTGSYARGGAGFEPGFSDLDLFVITEPLDVAGELALRRRLLDLYGTFRQVAPVVGSIDYLPLPDLTPFRRHGHAWTLDLEKRVRRLRGPPRLQESFERAPWERSVLRLAEAMRRWAKASPALLACGPSPSLAAWRASKRLLVDCAAAYLDADRGLPAGVLLSLVRATGVELPPVVTGDLPIVHAEYPEGSARILGRSGSPRAARRPLMSSPSAHRPTIVQMLAASLEVLDRFAARVGSDWTSRRAETRGHFPGTADTAVRALAEDAIRRGFSACYVAARDAAAVDHLLLVVGREDVRPTAIVHSASEWARTNLALPTSFSWAARPVVLTATLWKLAFLLDPGPLPFDSLAHAGAHLAGDRLPEPLAPSPEIEHVVVRSRMAQLLQRPRSRAFRASTAGRARRELLREVRYIGRPLLDRARFGAVSFETSRKLDATDTELIGELHGLIDQIHAELDA